MTTREKVFPLVSVIIPAYNEALRIGETLENLRRIQQDTYPNLEIIVSVNGSSDDTETIARQYTDTVFVSHKKGIAHANNLGVTLAQGEYLIFLDADCALSSQTISRIIEVADEHTVGTVSSYPDVSYLKPFVFFKLKNLIQRLHLVRGASGLLFCHRSLMFDKKIYFKPEVHLGEKHDFIYRARKLAHAKYKHVTVWGGCRISVDRYERFGYMNTLLFWVGFWFKIHFIRRFLKIRKDPSLFEKTYWES